MEEAQDAAKLLLAKCKSMDAKIDKLPASAQDLVCCSYTFNFEFHGNCAVCEQLGSWAAFNKLVSCMLPQQCSCILSMQSHYLYFQTSLTDSTLTRTATPTHVKI